uniref:NADH dehydrogenase subunit 6 n=1 Tax=Calamaria septentrionalis TaxID=1720245 RepID=UPI001FF2C7AD|nr:NADH dehydrogenase subunit 6 [Calamaria septentrionalis]UOD77177.1 NADH dehydrogenase subunit 6 [Calamaria septentrionalis]
MNYICGFIVMLMVFSVVVLSFVFMPHHGVVVLMLVSFFCCVFMVLLGRTFVALMMYIVYLGGLIVVFGYCVSVEKEVGVRGVSAKFWCVVVFFMVVLLWWLVGGVDGLLCLGLEDLMCLEVNGSSVFYCDGGVGLIICSWGLLVVLFSVLVVLDWSRLGGLRPF